MNSWDHFQYSSGQRRRHDDGGLSLILLVVGLALWGVVALIGAAWDFSRRMG